MPPVRARKYGPKVQNRRSEASRGVRARVMSACARQAVCVTCANLLARRGWIHGASRRSAPSFAQRAGLKLDARCGSVWKEKDYGRTRRRPKNTGDDIWLFEIRIGNAGW
jgi:hypothetical protein